MMESQLLCYSSLTQPTDINLCIFTADTCPLQYIYIVHYVNLGQYGASVMHRPINSLAVVQQLKSTFPLTVISHGSVMEFNSHVKLFLQVIAKFSTISLLIISLKRKVYMCLSFVHALSTPSYLWFPVPTSSFITACHSSYRGSDSPFCDLQAPSYMCYTYRKSGMHICPLNKCFYLKKVLPCEHKYRVLNLLDRSCV